MVGASSRGLSKPISTGSSITAPTAFARSRGGKSANGRDITSARSLAPSTAWQITLFWSEAVGNLSLCDTKPISSVPDV